MISNDKGLTITKRLEDNILGILRQKEQELDDQIHDYSLIENKFIRDRDEEALEKLRESRLKQLKEMHLKKQEYINKGHGRVIDVHSDKDFFEACRGSDSVVVHFYRPVTVRCRQLDEHLERVSKTHFETKFLRVNVEKTPFICERFNIWCIPTLMIIKDGKSNHSIVGFDEFGGDGFSHETFVRVLENHGIKGPNEVM